MIKHNLLTQRLPSRPTGFSLIEVIIVIAIIAIIAGVAYPSYQNSMMKSKRADAKVALTEAATRQERIYSQSGKYATNTDLAKLVVHTDGKSSPEGYYTISVDMDACDDDGSCYLLIATGKNGQDKDTSCATLRLNHLGQKTSTGGGTCW